MTRPNFMKCSLGALRFVQVLCLLLLIPIALEAQAPSVPTKWILAEGAANNFFTENILIGNPNAADVKVQITLLPQNDSGQPGTPIVIPAFTVKATSRYTFNVNSVPNLASGSISAVVECTTCTGTQGIVVERSMYWSDARKRGGHNSQGVLAPATTWYLAEGTTGYFETFILIANPDPTQTANVQVTYLREFSGPLAQTFTMGPNTRRTIYVNQGINVGSAISVFISEPFSTVVKSTNNVSLVVERSMYWNNFKGGHEATGVPAADKTWLFSEGATGGSPAFLWDTYLLLANLGDADAHIQLTFLRDAGTPVTCTGVVAAHHRKTIHANFLDDSVQALTCDQPTALRSAAFATKIVSTDQPIIAERAMYWTSGAIAWVDGHDTPGVNAEASKWAFAEGDERYIDHSGVLYNSYFLFSNSGTAPLPLKATFMREDGTGVVKEYTIAPQSRFTLPTSSILELSNQTFAAFFESENNATFVAERAVYWGDAYYGGHGSTGTPWSGMIAAPPPANLAPTVTAANIQPNHGPLAGGTQVRIQGGNFTGSTTVKFGTVGAASVTVTAVDQLTAITPAGVAPGAVDVTLSNPGYLITVPSGFTYDKPSGMEDANAIIARCPTAEEVAASDRDLILSFENDPTAGQIVCTAGQSSRDLTLLQAQVYRVLTIMRRLTFDTALPWTSNSLYGWLISSTHGIRFRGDIDTSFSGDPINIQTKNVSALAPGFSRDFRWVGTLIVLLVHEARHNNGFPHDCADGIKDRTIAELGAWGVQYYTDLFLSSHSNPSFITPVPCTGCALDTRASFLQDAEQICSTRFCQDHCP